MYLTGEKIREIRLSRGYNQEQLAEMANLNRVTIAKYESGKVEPGAQALLRIADALEVTVDQLLGRDAPQTQTGDEPYRIETEEVKILAPYMDRMPKDKRELLVNMAKLIFEGSAEPHDNNTES